MMQLSNPAVLKQLAAELRATEPHRTRTSDVRRQSSPRRWARRRRVAATLSPQSPR
jgi:hypothetical protein